jgi:gliding motility-associated lipoprotein GldH
MIKLKYNLLSLFALLLAFLNSCNDSNFYESEIELPGAIWKNDQAATFQTLINDTSQLFDINITISNSGNYRYSNIWLFIKSLSPDGFSQTDTAEFILAEDNGKWIGDKNGNLYSLDFKYKKQIRFPIQGNYTFEIVQGMRDLELKEISKLGFVLQKSK